MLKIKTILNNNAVVAIDNDNNEKVVVGKGIAFSKKVGDSINASLATKTYYLSSDMLNLKFQEILVSLPMEQLNIVDKIIDDARMSIGRKISDSLYISLSDHIHFSLLNYEKGIYVRNNLLPEIIRFYPEEFEVGLRAIDIIKEETGILLPRDETGFIALHIVNAETEYHTSTKDIYQATQIIEEVLSVVKNYFDIDIDENSLAFYRFLYHLRYFSQRIVNHSVFKEDEKDRELMEVLAVKYQQSYQCCKNIKAFIKVRYDIDIGYEEMLYLTIHIQRAIFSE